MAITKKEGKELAKLINDVVVWGNAVKDNIHTGDCETVKKFMSWHNESGRKINSLLKTEAVHLFEIHGTNEEY